MGGIGSGNRYRWNTKTTTDEVKRIDLRYLKRIGALSGFRSGSLKWTVGGEPSGRINYISYHDRLELKFRYRERGEDWRPVNQTIPYERTPCHYGGERHWFLCPNCNRRVAVLYGADVLFLCRHCYRLPYASQQEGYINNLISQKHKLGARIFEYYEYGEGWGKKKGMHWKTFNRLQDKYLRLERSWCDHMDQYLHRF